MKALSALFTPAMLKSYTRAFITTACGGLITAGVASGEDVMMLAGGGGVLVSLVWSYFTHR